MKTDFDRNRCSKGNPSHWDLYFLGGMAANFASLLIFAMDASPKVGIKDVSRLALLFTGVKLINKSRYLKKVYDFDRECDDQKRK